MIVREECVSHSVEETFAFGARVAPLVARGGVVALWGDLGTGKTHLAKGICRALGYAGIVSSPTFTLINEYPAEPPIVHVDLFRLEAPEQLAPIGLDELLRDGRVVLIEWPALAASLLPPDTLHVHCAYGGTEDERVFRMEREA